MWLCVDRIEKNVVILLDDDESIYRLSLPAYIELVGIPPAESAVLSATVQDGHILTAVYSEAETAARKEAAQARLNRLFGRS